MNLALSHQNQSPGGMNAIGNVSFMAFPFLFQHTPRTDTEQGSLCVAKRLVAFGHQAFVQIGASGRN